MSRFRNQGFTLLEVLVALAILAVAGIAVSRAMGASLSNTSVLQQKNMARWVADNELARVRLSGTWPGLEWKNNMRSLADQTWHVRVKSVKTAMDKMRLVKVEVRTVSSSNTPPVISLQTYISQQRDNGGDL